MKEFNQDNKPIGEKLEEEEENNEKKLYSAPDGRMYNASAEEIEELFDTKYLEKVNEFYDNETITGYESDPEIAEYKQKTKKDLEKLASSYDIKNLKPEEVSIALSFVAGQMGGSPHYKGENAIDEPESKKRLETNYQQAKEIFMESCKKIFPEIDDEVRPIDLIKLSHELYEKYSVVFDVEFKVSEVAEIAKVREIDVCKLRGIADKLEETLHFAESNLNDYSGTTYQTERDKGDISNVKEHKKKLVGLNRCIYELMLIRDRIYEKLYEDKDISVGEAREIDEVRENIK